MVKQSRLTERHQSCSDGVLLPQMIDHDIEVNNKEKIDTIGVSSINYDVDVSVRLAAVGFWMGIRRAVGWFGITLVIEHIDVGATSVGNVGV